MRGDEGLNLHHLHYGGTQMSFYRLHCIAPCGTAHIIRAIRTRLLAVMVNLKC